MNTPAPQTQLIEQLDKAESPLNKFFSLSLDLFCIKEHNGYFKQLNPAWEKVLGWSESEVRSQPWIEFVHPDDVEVTQSAVRRCNQGEIVEYENRYRHKDGSYRWLSWRVSQGEDGLSYAVGKDITAAKQSEEVLCDRLEFERLISTLSTEFINLSSEEIDAGINHALQVIGEFSGFDRSYVALFSEDGSEASLVYEWCSESAESVLSKRRRFPSDTFSWWMGKLRCFEMIQISTLAELPPEADSTRVTMQSVGTKSTVAVPMVRGKSLIGYVGFSAVKQEKTWSEDIVALLRIVGNIFANALSRKQAESKLRESERRFRAVFNQTFQLSSLLKLDGTVLEDNQTALDYCKLEHSDMVGNPFWELPCWTISPETQERLRTAIAEAAAGNVVRYEVDILSPDNTVVSIDFSLKPLKDETGQVELLIAEGRDLTERKRVEEALRLSEEQFRLAVDNFPGVFAIYDAHRRFQFVNEQGVKGSGLPESALLGHTDDEIFPPEITNSYLPLLQQAIETRTLQTKEWTITQPLGGDLTFIVTYVPMLDEQGEIHQILGITHDITERKQAEAVGQQAMVELEARVEERTAQLQLANEQLQLKIAEQQRTEAALRQNEEQFRTVFDQAPIGMALAHLDGRFFRVNQAFFEMLGYTESELMSLSFVDITHPEELEGEMPYVEQLIKGEIDTYKRDKRYLKKNQEILWGSLTCMAMRDQTGEVLYALGMIEDITERKQAEVALRESEARYRAIIEDQTELICRFKSDGTLTFVNDAYCRYFSKQPSELIGRSFVPVIPEEDQELVTQNISSLSPAEPIITHEHRVILPSGEIRWQQWTNRGVMFDDPGTVIEFQAVGRDITELKQAEAEMGRALEKEREVSKLRSSIVHLVSHQFRNPLTVIQFSADLLQNYNDKLSDESKLKHHTQIQSAVKRMTQLVDDVLFIGTAKAGKLKFDPSPIDLVSFCRDIVEDMQISASAQHMLNFVAIGDCTNVEIDAKLLGHIITNLLSNAIKYSPQGGSVQFDLNCTSDEAIFRIQDSGIGISPEDLQQLFEGFVRGRHVGDIPGTGLGLAIVKQCVDVHGGKISVESEVGVGTTFTVTLPLK
jgi:PAS domain S-box-containing protein